jgi:hypothetical protein
LAYHLVVMSLVNVGTLITGQLTRILISGLSIDWSQTSLFYCKFPLYLLQTCALISVTCLCLTVIDQYFVACSRPHWQQWSNIKLARRLSSLSILFGILSNIPYLIYYTHVVSPTTGRTSCMTTDHIFQEYVNYGSGLILGRTLPVSIISLFGPTTDEHGFRPSDHHCLDDHAIYHYVFSRHDFRPHSKSTHCSPTTICLVNQFDDLLPLLCSECFYHRGLCRVVDACLCLEPILHLFWCLGSVSSTVETCLS